MQEHNSLIKPFISQNLKKHISLFVSSIEGGNSLQTERFVKKTWNQNKSDDECYFKREMLIGLSLGYKSTYRMSFFLKKKV